MQPVIFSRCGSAAGIALVVTTLSACGGGSSSHKDCLPADGAPSPPECIASIVDPLATAELKAQGIPSMTIEIAHNGKLIYAQGYGTSNLATGSKAVPGTEYQIGSVTKQFTAAAVLQLMSAGQLGLDDPVEHYMPGYSLDSRLTVRMLLNQTSGLADYLDFGSPADVVQGVTQQEVLTAIGAAPLHFTPGSAFEYSNSNYYLLGVIIEAVSGQQYGDYLAEHIFTPAGLTHTSLAQPLTAAQPYSYDSPAPGSSASASSPALGIILDPSVYFAAGALWSNVGDLTLWDNALFSGQLLSKSDLQVMLTPPADVPVFGSSSVPSYYGMGWVSDTQLNHPFVWHNGETLAYTAFNGVFPESGWSISILVNVDMQERAAPLSFAKSIVSAICGSSAVNAGCF